LRPSFAMKYLRLWEEHFMYYSTLSKPLGLMANKVTFHEDLKEYLLLKKIKELKNELRELKDRNSNSPMIRENSSNYNNIETFTNEVDRNQEETRVKAEEIK